MQLKEDFETYTSIYQSSSSNKQIKSHGQKTETKWKAGQNIFEPILPSIAGEDITCRGHSFVLPPQNNDHIQIDKQRRITEALDRVLLLKEIQSSDSQYLPSTVDLKKVSVPEKKTDQLSTNDPSVLDAARVLCQLRNSHIS